MNDLWFMNDLRFMNDLWFINTQYCFCCPTALHIFFIQFNISDTIQSFCPLGTSNFIIYLQQSIRFRIQITLVQIASNNHFAAFTDTGRQHEHLCRRGVLHFICNNPGILECTSTHKSERNNLNNTFFRHPLNFFCRIGFSESIENRTRPWVHLRLQSTRQKPNFFVNRNDGSGHHNLIDFAETQCFDSGITRQHGFSGTGRTNGNNNIDRILSH